MTDGQRKTTSRKVPRIEAMKEPEKQPTLKDSRGRSRKAQSSESAQERKENPSVQTMEEEPPSQAKTKPTGIEPTSSNEEKQVELSLRDRFEVDQPPSKKTLRGGRNIFSDMNSDETSEDDDTMLISNKRAFRDAIRRTEVNPAQYKSNLMGRTSLIESSSDEEGGFQPRWPGRSKNAAFLSRKGKIDVDSSVEDNLPVESRDAKSKRPANSDMDTSPVAHRTLRKRQAKARYIFSGSSTDDDSTGSNEW